MGCAETGVMTSEYTEWILIYRFDETLERIVAIEVVEEGVELLGWDIVGESVWVKPNSFKIPGQPNIVQLS